MTSDPSRPVPATPAEFQVLCSSGLGMTTDGRGEWGGCWERAGGQRCSWALLSVPRGNKVPRAGGFNTRNLSPHNSGGWKSVTSVLGAWLLLQLGGRLLLVPLTAFWGLLAICFILWLVEALP